MKKPEAVKWHDVEDFVLLWCLRGSAMDDTLVVLGHLSLWEIRYSVLNVCQVRESTQNATKDDFREPVVALPHVSDEIFRCVVNSYDAMCEESVGSIRIVEDVIHTINSSNPSEVETHPTPDFCHIQSQTMLYQLQTITKS